MNTETRIQALAELGNYIKESPVSLLEAIHTTYLHNTWFTKTNTLKALNNISTEFLSKDNLEKWVEGYGLSYKTPKIIATVAAGNIPMVAFHDILCILVSGNSLQLKLSDKDSYLLPHLLEKLTEFEPEFKDFISIQPKLENFDAIIATGSNNTAKHFEYYFGKYKNIIRRNRNSIAVLTGNETKEELTALGADIFDYFGLGCRNVSKIFVPQEYDLYSLKEGFSCYSGIMEHNQYMNNLDYQRTLFLMNQTHLIDIDFINIVENKSLHSPISCLHVERYETLDEVTNFIIAENENIQCVIGKDFLPFGKSQQPRLNDYADNIDTMKFILEL
ncbi:MAG: acyl-CoA reductase [Sphingobacteriales bacterium]|jgi:hypothetical protein|nr:acyl-CoA reductase [Sphingobacteriales bacterium]